MEIWKDIKGYENKYQISNFGRVKSIMFINGKTKFKKEKILKPLLNNKGYLIINLYKDCKIKRFLIHRLVSNAFIENPNNYLYVNHKDKNRQNNHVSNLEWCTQSYNVIHGRGKKINQYDKQGNFIKTWSCGAEIKKTLGIDQGLIIRCCKKIKKSAGGFKWKYN